MMKDDKNLSRKEKVKKIGEMVKVNPICMMATNLVKTPFSVYPMTTLEVVDKGDLIFFTNKESTTFKEIEEDNRVQLLYANHNKQEYLSLFGHATHILDDIRLNKLWRPFMKRWFKSKNDPDLVILSVSIVSADYWITENNAMESFLFDNEMVNSGESGFINLANYGDKANS